MKVVTKISSNDFSNITTLFYTLLQLPWNDRTCSFNMTD